METVVSYEHNNGSIVTVFKTRVKGKFSYNLQYCNKDSKSYSSLIKEKRQRANRKGFITTYQKSSSLSKILGQFNEAVKAIKEGIQIKQYDRL